MKNRFLLPLLIVMTALSSCISSKEMRYFQDDDLTQKIPAYYPQELPDYKLIPNDIISVQIKTDKPELNEAYNMMSDMAFNQGNPGANYLSGYAIDLEGNIALPEVGKVQVAGLTVSEARDTIEARLESYFVSGVSIFVHLLNFKVSVLGEVRNPGYYYIYNQQINILEALALAGDMTEVGNRQEVFLIRQQSDGSVATPVDLRQVDLITSEFYFLQPNDVIYVAPLDAKAKRSNLVGLNLVNTIISGVSLAISSAALIVNLRDDP